MSVGRQEEHPACKIEMRCWCGIYLERCADCLHIVELMPLHPKTQSSLVSFKSRLVLPNRYRLTQVVLEKRPLNGCSSSNSGSSVSSSSNNHSTKLHRFLGHKHRTDGRIAACADDGLISRHYVHRRYHGNTGHVTPTTSSLGHIPGRSLIEVKTLVDSKSASRQPRPSKGRADGAATVAGGVARSLFNDRVFGALCSRPRRSILALVTLERELLAPRLQRFSIARSLCKKPP